MIRVKTDELVCPHKVGVSKACLLGCEISDSLSMCDDISTFFFSSFLFILS